MPISKDPKPCTTCDGTKKVNNEVCPSCRGTGRKKIGHAWRKFDIGRNDPKRAAHTKDAPE